MSDAIVILEFELDFDAGAARAEEERMLETRRPRVIANLSRMKFVSSAELGFLIHFQKRLRDRGGELALSEPTPFFMRVILMLEIDDMFPVFGSDDEALAHFGADSMIGVTTRGVPSGKPGSVPPLGEA